MTRARRKAVRRRLQSITRPLPRSRLPAAYSVRVVPITQLPLASSQHPATIDYMTEMERFYGGRARLIPPLETQFVQTSKHDKVTLQFTLHLIHFNKSDTMRTGPAMIVHDSLDPIMSTRHR